MLAMNKKKDLANSLIRDTNETNNDDQTKDKNEQ
jgi:hypothetical protein